MRYVLLFSCCILAVYVHAQEIEEEMPGSMLELQESPSTMELILELGFCDSTADGVECVYTFTNLEGARITVNSIPGKGLEMVPTANGHLEIKPDYLDKWYAVTFVLKKVYDEVADIMYDAWEVQELKPIPAEKPRTEKMKLLQADCEGDNCILVFENQNHDTVYSVPITAVLAPVITNTSGQLEVSSERLSKTYSVKYKRKLVKDYALESYSYLFEISEMKPTK